MSHAAQGNVRYEAECFVAGKTPAEIREEIARCEDLKHNYKWTEVGSRHRALMRSQALREYL